MIVIVDGCEMHAAFAVCSSAVLVSRVEFYLILVLGIGLMGAVKRGLILDFLIM